VKKPFFFIFSILLFLTLVSDNSSLADPVDMDTIETLTLLCNKDVTHSCYKIGEKHRILDKDEKKALPFYEKACLGGHFTACSHAGIVLMKRGTPYSKEFKQATKYFQMACEKKHDKACFNLGSIKYKEGRQKKAIKWFDVSCELGNFFGCNKSKKLKK
jgi:TPR repeat protein|tara:strand:- start:852 stop:1328 length:477 start_codon:yes stop_codon:yes gene_type:complete